MVIVATHWQCRHCGEMYIPADEQEQSANLISTAKENVPAHLPKATPPWTIKTAYEYWPALHLLADASDRQGLGTDERIDAIVKQLLNLPPTVRRQLLADMLRLSMELPDLHAAATAAVNQAEQPGDSKRFRRGVG